MGVNAVRTTHNIPAVELLELADDTHANEHSLEITRYLKEQVLLHDPYGHAPVSYTHLDVYKRQVTNLYCYRVTLIIG